MNWFLVFVSTCSMFSAILLLVNFIEEENPDTVITNRRVKLLTMGKCMTKWRVKLLTMGKCITKWWVKPLTIGKCLGILNTSWVLRREHTSVVKVNHLNHLATHSTSMQYTVKPIHAVTSIKQSPVLKGHLFLFCRRTFKMNWTSFKRSPVL